MPITFNLENYISKIYIETGILHGESIQKAIDAGFDKIYAIDVNPIFIKENKLKFKDEIKKNRLKIFKGLSTEVLPKILNNINEKSTIFLDAHDLGYDGIPENKYGYKNECPILDEINIISNHSINNHNIIIDDIKMIITNYGWADGYNISLDMIKEKVLLINKNYKFELIDDINGCLICYV